MKADQRRHSSFIFLRLILIWFERGRSIAQPSVSSHFGYFGAGSCFNDSAASRLTDTSESLAAASCNASRAPSKPILPIQVAAHRRKLGSLLSFRMAPISDAPFRVLFNSIIVCSASLRMFSCRLSRNPYRNKMDLREWRHLSVGRRSGLLRSERAYRFRR